MSNWRWDQGRLNYFQFENLEAIAHVLHDLEGIIINQKDYDPLRSPLEKNTGLPFAPASYRVWRNYKRVFECSLLATSIDNRLYVTDFCRRIASGQLIDADEYLSLLIPKFRYPFAAFNEYKKSNITIYPFCAILKYLLSQFELKQTAFISLDDVFSLIIGNKCTGLETTEYYQKLNPTNYIYSPDEKRQVREMLIFLSQLSILKWYQGTLYLDIAVKDYEDYNAFKHLITPIYRELKDVREEEFMAISSLNSEFVYPFKLQSREIPTDENFIEGKRSRVTHVKIERSPLLRKLFFQKNPDISCDMCESDMKSRYPWTENILEVHHILPLSSTLTITSQGTSLEDVVGLCPNCHKSVHVYYKNWLNKYKIEDFKSRTEAKEIYYEAKTHMVL